MPKTAKAKAADPLLEFCRALPGATEDVKWGADLIFSVGGKMFAGFQMPDGQPIGFKVEPLAFDGIVGRDGIVPAPYMARHSWVSVTERKKIPQPRLQQLLRESHRLVAEKLPKRTRATLGID